MLAVRRLALWHQVVLIEVPVIIMPVEFKGGCHNAGRVQRWDLVGVIMQVQRWVS